MLRNIGVDFELCPHTHPFGMKDAFQRYGVTSLLRNFPRFNLHLLDALCQIIEHLFLIHKWLPINAICNNGTKQQVSRLDYSTLINNGPEAPQSGETSEVFYLYGCIDDA